MNKIYKYLLAACAALFGSSALTSCQDDFDDRAAQAPVATMEPNISIAEFKALFWQDETNYCVEVPAREDGSHYIISARVISSDYDGNIFKCLYIQDETAALAMSINQYNLYMTNRVGQELVIDLTGMYVGKYNGMQQLGFPAWYEAGNCWETSFMAPELFNAHVEYNGNPEPAKIDTITVADLGDLSDLQKWQGQLVRFNNATFANGNNPDDNLLCNEYHSSGYNQALNVNGGSIIVRTSGYAKFWNVKLPKEACDVVGILGYYGTTGWQLLLNDANGIMNIGNPTEEGSKNQPYTVTEAIDLSAKGTASGWVQGYIVGTVAPEVTTVTSNSDISWSQPFIMDNTLVIAASPEVRDYTQCMVISLNEGTKLYEVANLADNPQRLGLKLNVQGKFATSMGMAAVTNNPGTPATFVLEGVEIEDPTPQPGDGTEATPYTVTQAIGLNNPGSSAWVSGYIVGVINYDNNSSLETTVPTTVATCIAIAATPDETDQSKCMAVQLPVGDVRTALNLKDNPANLGKVVTLYGSLEKYFGICGIKNTSAYKLEGGSETPDTPVTPPSGDEGNGTEASPYNCASVIALGNPGTANQWIEGYIIGVIDYAQNSSLVTGANTTVNTCIAIADSPSETVKENCVAIQLPIGDVRDALNLASNPGVLGKKVQLCGSLEKYFGIAGLKNTSAYKLEGGNGGGDTPVTPPAADGGTEAQPYTITQVLALNNPGTVSWVEGYIVGWTPTSFTAMLTVDNAVASNVLLAETPDETDPAKMVPLHLPSGSAVRTLINIKDNPGNFHKKIKVEGTLEAYFPPHCGIKNPTTAIIL